MSDHLPRTNLWLIALSVVLCLILGGIFTRSSAVTSQADAISDAELSCQKIRIMRSLLLRKH